MKDKNIPITNSSIRFIVKVFFGFISLTLILFTRKHQALHDIASGSIVVLKSKYHLDENEVLQENVIKEKGYKYPNVIKRIVVSIFYIFMLNILLGIPSIFLISEKCFDDNICNQTENVIQIVIGIIFIAASLTIFISGLKGKIYGARRKLIVTNSSV